MIEWPSVTLVCDARAWRCKRLEQVTWDQTGKPLITKGLSFIKDAKIFDIMGVNMQYEVKDEVGCLNCFHVS